jgi:Flp pilus assembly protein TadG
MRYIRSLRRRQRDPRDRGSQTVGFSLVAPLLALLAVLVMQIVGLATCRVTVALATHEAARIAAAQGSTADSARTAANKYLVLSGFTSCGKVVRIYRKRESDILMAVAHVEQCLAVPFFGKQVRLVSESSQVDESDL